MTRRSVAVALALGVGAIAADPPRSTVAADAVRAVGVEGDQACREAAAEGSGRPIRREEVIVTRDGVGAASATATAAAAAGSGRARLGVTVCVGPGGARAQARARAEAPR